MADSAGDGVNDNQSGPSSSSSSDSPQSSSQGSQAVINHMSSNKVEAAMWLSRLVSIFFTLSFILPVFGVSQYSSGQRVLISGALTSALRLHQRMPQFRLNREFLTALFTEDSSHYLMYSIMMLYTTQPASMILMPVFLFALLHVTKYSKTLLDLMGPSSLQFVRNLITKVETNQTMMLKLIATVEITLMPTAVLMIFFGQAALLLPFIYYRFLCLRYTSVRNPYSRQVFYELRVVAEHYSRDPRCPQMIQNILQKAIAFICRMSPIQVAQTATN